MGLLPLEFSDCLLDSPYFRENLRAHEKQLDQTASDIKNIISNIQVGVLLKWNVVQERNKKVDDFKWNLFKLSKMVGKPHYCPNFDSFTTQQIKFEILFIADKCRVKLDE